MPPSFWQQRDSSGWAGRAHHRNPDAEESLPAPDRVRLASSAGQSAHVIGMMHVLITNPCRLRAERALSGAVGKLPGAARQLRASGWGRLRLRAFVASRDGAQLVRAESTGDARVRRRSARALRA
jgi:hypothetical protein